jgi:3-hydroxybutyrate dehydrogenase
MISLAGRRALVTGGAGGMGREIARALASAGAEVVIADVDEAPLREAGEALGLPTMRLDLASCAAIRRFAPPGAVIEERA